MNNYVYVYTNSQIFMIVILINNLRVAKGDKFSWTNLLYICHIKK
jgi:hypothetical protein